MGIIGLSTYEEEMANFKPEKPKGLFARAFEAAAQTNVPMFYARDKGAGPCLVVIELTNSSHNVRHKDAPTLLDIATGRMATYLKHTINDWGNMGKSLSSDGKQPHCVTFEKPVDAGDEQANNVRYYGIKSNHKGPSLNFIADNPEQAKIWMDDIVKIIIPELRWGERIAAARACPLKNLEALTPVQDMRRQDPFYSVVDARRATMAEDAAHIAP